MPLSDQQKKEIIEQQSQKNITKRVTSPELEKIESIHHGKFMSLTGIGLGLVFVSNIFITLSSIVFVILFFLPSLFIILFFKEEFFSVS